VPIRTDSVRIWYGCSYESVRTTVRTRTNSYGFGTDRSSPPNSARIPFGIIRCNICVLAHRHRIKKIRKRPNPRFRQPDYALAWFLDDSVLLARSALALPDISVRGAV
jgi:hypothetical protein